jgi:hypothetical protein
MGTQEYRGIGEVKITFFIEDHMVTSLMLNSPSPKISFSVLKKYFPFARKKHNPFA